MRNILLTAFAALAIYLYLHPQTPPPPPAEQPPVVAQVAPPPARMYYHSPLDAGAMPANYSTGGGYYSTDPTNSRFTAGHVPVADPASASNGYPVSRGGTSINNPTVYTGTGGRATTATSQP